VLAAIPYTTFPDIPIGPVTLRTFGIMVALGVVAGTVIASRWGERFGVPADDTISLATRMVLAGVVGSRVTWVLTHTDAIDSPLDLIAVWEGGLQFSGGFIAAVLVGLPSFRKWDRATRWRMLDGSVLGLTVGAAVGRIGCYAVGEHLGGPTDFVLGTRYQGGPTREGPLEVGQVIHNTSLYEFLSLVALGLVLAWLLLRRRARPGTALGVFLVWYSASRFGTDFLRAYDDTVLGLTGAQWMCLVLFPVGVAVLFWYRRRVPEKAPVEPGSDPEIEYVERGGAPKRSRRDEDTEEVPVVRVPRPETGDGPRPGR
jgi:phosphatidylglycerol---prolipoprotein diacylglyceryl transferase